MDITPKYIKMCEKAEEMRELSWENNLVGHLIWSIPLQTTIQCDYSVDQPREEEIFLPRQDQLQEMIPCLSTHINIQNLHEFANNIPDIESWEQLWLKFFMYVQFDKTWNDKKEEWELK